MVISEAIRVSSDDDNEVLPDYFRYYIRTIRDILSQDDILSPSSRTPVSSVRTLPEGNVDNMNTHSVGKEGTALFCDGVGDDLSDLQKERLRITLKESVTVLSQEVDETLNSVIAIYQIKVHLRNKECLSTCPNSSQENIRAPPCKKQKQASSPSSTTTPIHVATDGSQSCSKGSVSKDSSDSVPSEESHFGAQKKSCSNCKATRTPQWRKGPDGLKSLCNACGIQYKKNLTMDTNEVKENTEVNEDLKILIESGGSLAKEALKRYSDELSTKLGQMEQQLEELLDVVLSKCRQMNLAEKQRLQKLIKNLPPKNLDRVAEIVQRRKPKAENPRDEIHIDLEKEDNLTLWRLYYYVEAVESAKKLSS